VTSHVAGSSSPLVLGRRNFERQSIINNILTGLEFYFVPGGFSGAPYFQPSVAFLKSAQRCLRLRVGISCLSSKSPVATQADGTFAFNNLPPVLRFFTIKNVSRRHAKGV
jgi:hypothetical protein